MVTPQSRISSTVGRRQGATCPMDVCVCVCYFILFPFSQLSKPFGWTNLYGWMYVGGAPSSHEFGKGDHKVLHRAGRQLPAVTPPIERDSS